MFSHLLITCIISYNISSLWIAVMLYWLGNNTNMPTYSIETIQIDYIFLTIFPTHSWLSPWAYNPKTEDNVNHNGVPTGAFCVCLASWPWLPLTSQACWHAGSYSQEANFLPFLKLQIQSFHHWLLPGPPPILSLEESRSLPQSLPRWLCLPPRSICNATLFAGSSKFQGISSSFLCSLNLRQTLRCLSILVTVSRMCSTILVYWLRDP